MDRGTRMSTEQPKRPWEQQLRDAMTHLETDLRNVVKYVNDEVVPDVRKNGSEWLRAAIVRRCGRTNSLRHRRRDVRRRLRVRRTMVGLVCVLLLRIMTTR